MRRSMVRSWEPCAGVSGSPLRVWLFPVGRNGGQTPPPKHRALRRVVEDITHELLLNSNSRGLSALGRGHGRLHRRSPAFDVSAHKT